MLNQEMIKPLEKSAVKKKRDQETVRSPEQLAEMRRRAGLAKFFNQAIQLDRDFFANIKNVPDEEMDKTIGRLDAYEALSFGKEIAREQVGESGINPITKRTYEGNPPVVAYVKPQLGESSFSYDPLDGSVLIINKRYDEKKKQVVEDIDLYASSGISSHEQQLVDKFREVAEAQEELHKEFAECYGISPDQVPLKKGEFSPRQSIDANSFTVREYAVSRINELLNFDVVPLTTLRAETVKEKDAKGQSIRTMVDVSSVQQAFEYDPTECPTMFKQRFAELLAQGPEHKGAKSLMRIACLDYLVKACDRHTGNILYDEKFGKFAAIDNGLSLGLSKAVKKRQPDGRIEKTMVPHDPYRSLPMEIVQHHEDWKLDDEAVENLKRIYDSVKDYLKLKEDLKKKAEELKAQGKEITLEELEQQYSAELKRKAGGKEIKFITGLFRLIYGHEKIAVAEGFEFINKVRYLISRRRPPQLTLDNVSGGLYPISRDCYVEKAA